MDQEKCLQAMRVAAFAAAAQIRDIAQQGYFEVKDKGGEACNLVTEADHAAEKAIIRLLHKEGWNFKVISEEKDGNALGAIDTSAPVFIVDPLDGTVNFAHGDPNCTVSIALWHEGAPRIAVVREVWTNRTYSAVQGKGATLNTKPCRVTQHARMAEGMVGFNWPVDPVLRANMRHFRDAIFDQALQVRAHMACVLETALVAAGTFGAHVNVRLFPWDGAAVALLVTEAGGRVTNMHGQPWTLADSTLVASNGHMHEEVLALLQESYKRNATAA